MYVFSPAHTGSMMEVLPGVVDQQAFHRLLPEG